jgi:hypothetical protein
LNTLPALLHHLTTLQASCNIRLKSIEETGGGATVVISVGDADAATLEALTAEAHRFQAAQFALRDDQIAQLKIENRLLLDEVIPRVLAAARQRIQIHNATGIVIAGDNAFVHAEQTINDLSAIRAVLDEIMSRRAEWGLAHDQAEQIQRAIREVQNELKQSQPRHPMVSEGLKTVRDFVVGALGNATGTALATNTWQPLLNQLQSLLKHLTW